MRCAALGRADARFGLRQLDVLPRGQHRQQEEALEHEADLAQPEPAALRVGQRPDVAILKQHLAARRRVDAAEHVQQRRLAAARRTDDADVLAGRDPQRHVAQRATGPGRHREDPRARSALRRSARHETTSRRSVAAIGSAATIRIGYDRGGDRGDGEQRGVEHERSRLEDEEVQIAPGMPGSARRIASSHTRQRDAERQREHAARADEHHRLPQHAGDHARRDSPRARSAAISPSRWLTDTVSSTAISRNPKNSVMVASTAEI